MILNLSFDKFRHVVLFWFSPYHSKKTEQTITFFLQVLHLIGIALHEQKRAIEDGNHQFDFLSKACKSGSDTGKSKKGK